MAWLRWMVVALAVFEAGYMVVDGTYALITGDYITPRSGDYAGQLGPWTKAVETLGLDPRSTLMKAIFIGYGAIWLGVTVAFAANQAWAWAVMVALAIGSLWYLVVGTGVSIAVTVLLFLPAVRDIYRG